MDLASEQLGYVFGKVGLKSIEDINEVGASCTAYLMSCFDLIFGYKFQWRDGVYGVDVCNDLESYVRSPSSLHVKFKNDKQFELNIKKMKRLLKYFKSFQNIKTEELIDLTATVLFAFKTRQAWDNQSLLRLLNLSGKEYSFGVDGILKKLTRVFPKIMKRKIYEIYNQ